MQYQPVQFVRDGFISGEQKDVPILAGTLLFKCADDLLFDYKFKALEWGFEIADIECGFYGLFSCGQHGRWECVLIRMGIDGDLETLGKASVSTQDSLAAWYNGQLNHYHQRCLESRLRVKVLVEETAQACSIPKSQWTGPASGNRFSEF